MECVEGVQIDRRAVGADTGGKHSGDERHPNDGPAKKLLLAYHSGILIRKLD
jgi:hypothetical protein